MKRFLLLALLLACCSVSQAEIRRLVMVTATPELAEIRLSPRDIRKLYLGRAIIRNDRRLIPLINRSDPLLYQIFLQKSVLLSSNSYERFLLSKVFRSGGSRPQRYDSLQQLIQALLHRPHTVSYMWAVNARDEPRLRIIKEIWRGNIK